MANRAPIRVFQVATGNLGTEMIKRIASQPDLELIGLHCYTTEKVGRDAGEIAGLITSADIPLRGFAGRFKP
jgi:4-hydroxy-tetrahydrodipicolinate reductase